MALTRAVNDLLLMFTQIAGLTSDGLDPVVFILKLGSPFEGRGLCSCCVCVFLLLLLFFVFVLGVGVGCRVLNEPHRFSIDLDLVENSAIPTIRSSTENSEMFVCLLTFLSCKNPDVYTMLNEKFRVR